MVVPIKWHGFNLDDILWDFLAVRSCFPLGYIGFPLSLAHLWHHEFQPLWEKVVGKEKVRNDKIFSTSCASASLWKYWIILTSFGVPTFVHLVGCDKVPVGKCKVKCDIVYHPKEFGGPAVLSLGKYEAALRICRLCMEWIDASRKWICLGKHFNERSGDLFADATFMIHLMEAMYPPKYFFLHG